MQKHVIFVVKKSYYKLTKNKNYRKVRDHSHYTSKYRGTADSICNSKFNVPNDNHVFIMVQTMIIILL